MLKFIPNINYKKYKLKNFILKPSSPNERIMKYYLHLYFQDSLIGYIDIGYPTTTKKEGASKYFCVKNGYHQRIGKVNLEYNGQYKRWELKKAEFSYVTHTFLSIRKTLTEKWKLNKKYQHS